MPKNNYFSKKNRIYSVLKQQNVPDMKYKNSESYK